MDFEYLVKEILEKIDDLDEARVKDLQRIFAKDHKMTTLPSKSQIIETYLKMIEQGKIEKNEKFEHLLRKRAIRSLSGIVSVQVLTKPRPCPWKCIFCPNDPTMPKSYIKSEPWAMRAFLNQFDPRKQVYNRLQSLTLTGHQPKKIEMIVLGGSRDAYPQEYKENFIKELYDACNTFSQLKIKMNNAGEKKDEKEKKFWFTITNEAEIEYSSTLEEALKKNETAEHRIIGLTIETRPDLVSHRNCQSWRKFGVTRVEMGIQSTNDEVLELNKRGHNLEAIKQALHLLRKYGFKISIHLMPGLYGSDFEKDIQSFRDTFSDPWLKPDELKFYPTSVIPNTELYTFFKEGKYEPLTTEKISQIIKKTFKEIIPPYTRIKRLIRDIPATEIAAGSNVTNLSQLVHDQLLKEYQQKIQHSDTKNEVETFYRRLYGEYELFNNEEEYFENLSSHKELDNKPSFWTEWNEVKNPKWNTKDSSNFSNDFTTKIIGSQPDFKSFRHFVSLDTRSREVRNKKETTKNLNLILRMYQSSVGKEIFISYEDELGYLYGFTRLLLPLEEERLDFEGLGKENAIIRELHVYGELQAVGEKSDSATQHSWLGKKLLKTAEMIAQKEGFTEISVISWIGVREYYEKQGFKLEGTYMKKTSCS